MRADIGLTEKPELGAIRVLIADTNRILSELLAEALQRSPYHFRARAHAGNASLRPTLTEYKPQVAVIGVDPRAEPLAGFELLREFHTHCPRVPTVSLIDTANRDLVIESFRQGAKGVFSRNESFADLCKCVLCVYHGQVWARHIELQYVLEELERSAPSRYIGAKGNLLLTKREQEVANLVAQGLTNRTISEKLQLTEHTVKNYVFHIFEKLGISTRVELALYTIHRR